MAFDVILTDFAGESLGAGIPTGWVGTNGIFVAGSSVVPPRPGTSNIVFRYNTPGAMEYPAQASVNPSGYTETTMSWTTMGGPSQEPFVFGLNNCLTSGPIVNCFSMSAPSVGDGSTTLSAPGATSVNTQLPYFLQDCWMFMQLNISVGSWTPGGGSPQLQLIVTLTINGIAIISGAVFSTNLLLSALPAGQAINQWSMNSPGSGWLADIGISSSLLPVPTYPFPVTPVNMRLANMPAEVILAPPNRNMRLAQVVSEMIKAPPNRNMRLAQFVVEIIKRGGGQQAGFFPEYIKSHQRPGH